MFEFLNDFCLFSEVEAKLRLGETALRRGVEKYGLFEKFRKHFLNINVIIILIYHDVNHIRYRFASFKINNK